MKKAITQTLYNIFLKIKHQSTFERIQIIFQTSTITHHQNSIPPPTARITAYLSPGPASRAQKLNRKTSEHEIADIHILPVQIARVWLRKRPRFTIQIVHGRIIALGLGQGPTSRPREASGTLWHASRTFIIHLYSSRRICRGCVRVAVINQVSKAQMLRGSVIRAKWNEDGRATLPGDLRDVFADFVLRVVCDGWGVCVF